MRDDRPIVFLGTPDAAATILERLITEGFRVVHVVTRPDARRGRGGSTSPSPVKATAEVHGIEVSHDLSWLDENANPGLLGIVVAYGRIIPSRLLGRMQMVNVHFSLLPRWRGAAPVERAILAGDPVTGVCLMEVEPTLDTGPVYARAEIDVPSDSTIESLTAALADVGGALLVQTLRSGLPNPQPQEGSASYAEKVTPTESRIDWGRTAIDIDRQVRALRAHTFFNGARLRVVECSVGEPTVGGASEPGRLSSDGCVATADGAIRLVRVQPEGKPVMEAAAWLRGLQGIGVLRFD